MIDSPQVRETTEQPRQAGPDPTPATIEKPEAGPVYSQSLRRSPFLASVLSIVPGLGQIYVGYYQVGFLHAIVISVLLTVLATGNLGPATALFSVFMAFFWLYNIVDAGRRAVLVNEALAGRGTFELPEDFAAPGLQGSIVGGAILVAVGLLLLSRTMFDVSLEWLEDWWPIAIVLFGGYLIYKASRDKTSSSRSTDANDD